VKKHSKTQEKIPVETIGIDLGDKMSRYCIVNQGGQIVEEGSFRNQVSSLEAHFSGESRRIAVEAGAQSAWIRRELKRLGHEVIVANARELKWITASDTKNDPANARKLALLARADVQLLAPVEHRTSEQQAELAVIRARDAILRTRTLLINSARGIAKGFGTRLPKSITATFGQRALVDLPETRGAVRIAATDRCVESADPQLRPTSQRAGRTARGGKAIGEYSRRGAAHGDDVRAHPGPCRAVRAQPGCSRVPGLAA
jgi:transposase